MSADIKGNSGVQGYNAAIIAYGQTGTGKTFTMEGAHSGPSRGIIPRAIEDVFMYIENDRNAAQSKFLVRASYLQIYNEVRMMLLCGRMFAPSAADHVHAVLAWRCWHCNDSFG